MPTSSLIANRFKINDPKNNRLGEGAMGEVFLGLDSQTQEVVAIKVLKPNVIHRDPTILERFKREGEALRQLNHPNIVKMLAAIEENGQHYLVMEYIEGGSLSDISKKEGQLSLERVLQIALDLADALTRAHRLNIIHRDLKPDNVLLASDGTPRLADFGIAHTKQHTIQLTQTGAILGTVAYLSPEVCQGESPDTRADIWAFGVMLYEMLSGELPFFGPNLAATLIAILSQALPDLTQYRPDIPAGLLDLIKRMLIKDHTERIPTVRLVGAELEALLHQTSTTLTDTKKTLAAINIHNYYYNLHTLHTPSIDETHLLDIDLSPPDLSLASPYRGLFHFGPNDADIFFGRDVFIEQLLKLVQQRSIIAVMGASGSGKSSVVLAGLVPELEQSGQWQFTHFRPGSDPFQALAVALTPLYAPHLDELDQLVQIEKLSTYFREGQLSLTSILSKIQSNNPNTRLLLIADQFEELYTLTPDPTTRHRFLDILLKSISPPVSPSPRPPIMLVFTMRADFLGHGLSYRPFAEVLQQSNVMLGPMNRAELAQAIEKPAQTVGIAFEQGLVERILDDVGTEPGNLPLLEFALSLLWEKRTASHMTHAAYQAIGQVAGALAQHADKIYDGLTENKQTQIRRIFIQLVRPGEGTEDTRRTALKTELEADTWPLVKHLADARLIVTGRNAAGEETVEVVHEALIRSWGQLRQWMAEDRGFRVWQERLRVALKQWLEAGQDEADLLRGSLLAEAEERLSRYQSYLNDGEQHFIKASLTHQEEKATREAQRQQEKLEAAQKLAEAQAQHVKEAEARAKEQSQFNEVLKKEIRRATASRLAAQASLATNKREHRASSLPLMLAREAVLSTLTVDGDITNDAEAALRHAVEKASPWQMTLPRHRHTKMVTSVTFSPDGQWLVTASSDQTIRLWDAHTGAGIRLFKGHTDWVTRASFSPDGQQIVSTSKDQTIRLWDTQIGTQIACLEGHVGRVNNAFFSPDVQYIVSASDDGTARLWDIESRKEIRCFTGHTQAILWAEFSPNSHLVVTASVDQTAQIWSVETGQLVTCLKGHTAYLRSASFSPSGHHIITASSDTTARIWSAKTGQEIVCLHGHTDTLWEANFSLDGHYIVTASTDKTVRVWQLIFNMAGVLENVIETAGLAGHIAFLTTADFSPDGTCLATTSKDRTIRLWDTNTGAEIGRTIAHLEAVTALSFSPDGRMLLSGSEDGTTKLWRIDKTAGEQGGKGAGENLFLEESQVKIKGQGNEAMREQGDGENFTLAPLHPCTLAEVKQWVGHKGAITGGAFSPDGKWMVTIGENHMVKMWPLAQNSAEGMTRGEEQKEKVLQGHTGPVRSLDFSPDERYLLTASDDHTARLWHLETGGEIGVVVKYNTPLTAACFSPDGCWLATAGTDDKLQLWSLENTFFERAETAQMVETPLAMKSLQGHTGLINTVKFSPDGQLLLTASDDHTACLWKVTTGVLIDRLEGHSGPIIWASFNPDKTQIGTISVDKTARLWNYPKKTAIQVLTGHTDRVYTVEFSPDGHTLLTASRDSTARLWDIKTGQEIACLSKHTAPVFSASFSPDEQLLVTASSDHTARLWTVQSGEEMSQLQGHTALVLSASFSPDGQWLMTTSNDQTVRLWSVQSGQEVIRLQGHTAIVHSANFSPDGQWLVTASDDQTIRLWAVQSGQEVARLQGHTAIVRSANFSPDGRWLVTASFDWTVRVWQLLFDDSGIIVGGQTVQRLEGHTSYIRSANFSPDGRWLVTASFDRTVRVWQLLFDDSGIIVGGQTVQRLEGHTSYVISASFSPDGMWIATASWDHTVRLWPARLWTPIKDVLAQAEKLIQREPPIFTPEEREQFQVKNEK